MAKKKGLFTRLRRGKQRDELKRKDEWSAYVDKSNKSISADQDDGDDGLHDRGGTAIARDLDAVTTATSEHESDPAEDEVNEQQPPEQPKSRPRRKPRKSTLRSSDRRAHSSPVRKEHPLREAPSSPGSLTEPPSVHESAFAGPPRYDWIDIETSAAVRIQSIFRRNQAMERLEAKGLSTSAMRNRRRRQKAKAKARSSHRSRVTQAADAPSILQCCGVGLAFGDATEEDDDAYQQYQKRQYEEQQKKLEAHEAMLRKKFLKNHKHEIGPNRGVIETLEVVE